MYVVCTLLIVCIIDLQQVDSRIILDTYAWNRFNPNRQVSLNALTSPAHQAFDDDDDEEYSEDEYGGDSMDDILGREIDQPGQARTQSLTKDQLLLCSATLKGYSLKNKKWRQYYPLSCEPKGQALMMALQ